MRLNIKCHPCFCCSSGSLVVDFCLFLHPSLLFPGSGLVGYNAGSQPALQTDGPLIRCASALPLLPAARFLIKLKPKEEREGERNRGREWGWGCWALSLLALESLICLNRMNDDCVNVKSGRLHQCLASLSLFSLTF